MRPARPTEHDAAARNVSQRVAPRHAALHRATPRGNASHNVVPRRIVAYRVATRCPALHHTAAAAVHLSDSDRPRTLVCPGPPFAAGGTSSESSNAYTALDCARVANAVGRAAATLAQPLAAMPTHRRVHERLAAWAACCRTLPNLNDALSCATSDVCASCGTNCTVNGQRTAHASNAACCSRSTGHCNESWHVAVKAQMRATCWSGLVHCAAVERAVECVAWAEGH
jgi:hypothetical protein